jgi:hypothetical protein
MDSAAVQVAAPPRRRVWLWRLLAVALAIFMALVAAEIALRILDLGYGHSPHVGHPVFHHWHEPNFRMRTYYRDNEFGGFLVDFNSEGLCMREELPPRDEPCLVFLGDSFTMALQVPEEERYVTMVGKELGIRPVNLGCDSFSPLLSRLELEHYIDRLNPRAVVLQMYANDLLGHTWCEPAYRRVAKRDDTGKIVAVPGPDKPWYVRLGRRIYLVRLIRKVWLTYQFTQEMERRTGGDFIAEATAPLSDRPLDQLCTPEEISGIEESLIELRDVCRQRKIPFLLFVAPDRGALVHVGRDHFAEHYMQFAREHEITVIDMLQAIQSQADVQKYYFPTDMHFNAAGNQLTAQVVADALRETLEKDQPPASLPTPAP